MTTMTKETITREPVSRPQVNIIKERCVACQECIIRCPTEALSMDTAGWIVTANNDLCVGCRQCERTCPFSAITVNGPMVVTGRAHFEPHTWTIGTSNTAEVRPGFQSLDDAVTEAERCLYCPDPTCVRGCPAHNDIPTFIKAIRERDLECAEQVISQTSCLPDVCSRVCDWASQCEGTCSWALAGGESVAIARLERFVTDHSPVPPVNRTSERGKGLSVGIIGSGPAGIAAAWELAAAGASVTIYEREAVLGGVMQWGIPSYVLPHQICQRPIKALIDASVKFQMNALITPEVIDQLLKTHDAVIAAFGAPVPERPAIPGVDLEGVTDSTTFLTRAKRALADGALLPELVGAPVLVLGGSDTGIDVARSILRLGGRPIVIHRRDERFSRARQDEIMEAKAEGVEFRFRTNIARLEGESGKLKRAVLVHRGQKRAGPVPVPVNGTEHILDVSTVVLATGYTVDRAFSPLFAKVPLRQLASDRLLPDRRWQASGVLGGSNGAGRLAWEKEFGLQYSRVPQRDRLWLVGDALMGPSTVVGSMAQGRLAARAMLERQPHR